MQELASALTQLPHSRRAIGPITMQDLCIVCEFQASKGVNHVIMLAFQPVVQRNHLQLMGVNDFLRHALR